MPDPDELAELLRGHGLRPTPQRRAIVDAARRGGGHVTAESVFERVRDDLPTISLKTVYETLHSLVAVGVMRELVLGVGAIRFDMTPHPHHHVVCLECHRIEDVDLDEDATRIHQHQGFSIVRTDVTAWGLCEGCQADRGLFRP
jgi:Fe2+ or Zn2+ uptake regulation protein